MYNVKAFSICIEKLLPNDSNVQLPAFEDIYSHVLGSIIFNYAFTISKYSRDIIYNMKYSLGTV